MKTAQKPSAGVIAFKAIRVETALSRYPVHRLARHGDVLIDIREESEAGEVLIRWEVSHNSKYGQPGPLAYKLDTLIINRRIEEASRPIPRIIRLGSLNDICRELGQAASGGNTNQIKKSLHQNASTYITAKTRYRLADGSEQTLETGFTRYQIVFKGEKLPSGQAADCVYLILNDSYLKVINGAMTRPLDYEYLKCLPPAPQRFYELLSYQMYAALKNDRPRAKLTYSYYCTYSPQTRYLEWEQARKQMAKIHSPHKKSGYIGEVKFQDTTDAEGNPDWVMLYTPGPRARAEFQAFTKRGGPVMLEVEPIPLESDLLPPPPIQLGLRLELPPLATELITRGITQTIAVNLVEQFSAELVSQQIEVFDWLVEKQDKRVAKSPYGYLVESIRAPGGGYKIPKGFVTKAEEQRQKEARQAKERKEAEHRRREQEKDAAELAERQAIDAYWDSLTPAQQAELDAASAAQADPETLKLETGPFKSWGQRRRRHDYIRKLLAERKATPIEA
jgi:hypothetical protein